MIYRVIGYFFSKDEVLKRQFTETLNQKELNKLLREHDCELYSEVPEIGEIKLFIAVNELANIKVHLNVIRVK